MTQDGAALPQDTPPNADFRIVPTETLAAGDAEAINYLKKAVAAGKHWYPALLEAIGLWSSAFETYEGRDYIYLIEGEAFDWLLLAERLCATIESFIPENEMDNLLCRGIPPVQLEAAQVKEAIGDKKFGQYLNYFYGITVEEALALAVQEEVDKERLVQGLGVKSTPLEEVYRRIYDLDREMLLQQFREEKHLPKRPVTTLDEMKQFTYWLFKYRLKRCEKARIASDTRKALLYLKRIWQRRGVSQVLAADLAPSLPD
jgi:hypothetical protein